MTAPGYEYRAIYYGLDGKARFIRPSTSSEDSPEMLDFLLEHYIDCGYATGGHLETFVRGIGWVVYD